MLELDEGKRSRPVLRRGDGSNPGSLAGGECHPYREFEGMQPSSKRPAGGLGSWSDVFHGLAVASRAPTRRHAPPICTPELSRTNGHITDCFIDQPLFTADRAAIAVSLRQRA